MSKIWSWLNASLAYIYLAIFWPLAVFGGLQHRWFAMSFDIVAGVVLFALYHWWFPRARQDYDRRETDAAQAEEAHEG